MISTVMGALCQSFVPIPGTKINVHQADVKISKTSWLDNEIDMDNLII